MPFWNDLAGASQLLSDVAALVPKKIMANQDIAVKHFRGDAWSANDLAKYVAKCSEARCCGRSGQLHVARKVLNSSSSWMSSSTRRRAVSSSSRKASSQTASWPRPPQAKAGESTAAAVPPRALQF
jgi:hypothetical protein